MKKLFILMALMALPFAITSCGGDDDVSGGSETGYVGKPLTKPKNSDLSDKYYGITDKSKLPAEIEDVRIYVLGDGYALVLSKGGDILGNSAPSDKARKYLKKADETDVYAHTCKITQTANGVFTLDMYGTLDINKNAITFSVGPMAQQELMLSVLTSGVLTSTTLVDNLCRDWNIIQTNIEVTGGDLGSDGYSKNFKFNDARDLNVIATDIDGQQKLKNVQMKQHLGDRCTKIDHITLSRTGKITVAYGNGLVDVGDLLSIANNGNVSIEWPNVNLCNEYLRGELGVTAKIESNCLRLAFKSKVMGNVAEPYNVKVEFVMEWAN